MTDTEQLRAEFEAESRNKGYDLDAVLLLSKPPKFSHYTNPATQAAWEAYRSDRTTLQSKPLTVDSLAQEIRRVDGGHNLGAGALAEALMPFIQKALQSQDRASVMGAIQRLPRYNFGYVSDEWGMGRQLGAIRKDDGRFLRVDDVMEAIDHARRVEGDTNATV